jgi:hypothetical protein
MQQAKVLDRSTVETWTLAVLGILSGIVKMTWGWELALFIAMYAMVADLAVRSPWTIALWWPAKVALLALGLALLVAASGESIAAKYYETASRAVHPPLLIQSLTWANYYCGQSSVYLPLSVIALTLILWRFAPVSRLRHKALFLVRRTVTEQVWISRDAALKILAESRWAKVRRGPDSIWFRLGSFNPHEDSMFQHWCNQALDYFANEKNSRVVDGNKEIDETTLRKYLSSKYDEAVRKKFGDPY